MNKLTKILCLILAVCSVGLFMMSCKNDDRSDKAYYNYEESLTGKGTEIKTMFVEREIDSMRSLISRHPTSKATTCLSRSRTTVRSWQFFART